MKRNTNCTMCPLHEYCIHRCVWGAGNRKAKVMIIGEAPGMKEDLLELPFVGPAGDLLNHVFGLLGVDRNCFYITNAFKCRPLDNKLPGIKEKRVWFASCLNYLSEEIRTVKPKVMLLLGNTPLELIAGQNQIMKHEGMLVRNLLYDKAITIAGLHPAYILRSPSKEVRLAQAIARACLEGGVLTRAEKWISKERTMYSYEVRS